MSQEGTAPGQHFFKITFTLSDDERPPLCSELLHLRNVFAAKVQVYLDAAGALAQQAVFSSNERFMALKTKSDRARLACEHAIAEVEQHHKEHGCLESSLHAKAPLPSR